MKMVLTFVLSCLLIIGVCSCAKQDNAATWQEQYDLGVRYLSEGNYEEAIIAFMAAIEIDPKRPEAYLGLAEAYVAIGDTDKAIEILKQGLSILGDNEALTAALAALIPDPEPGEYIVFVSDLENRTLPVGERVSLAASIHDSFRSQVVWTSSSPEVATVDNDGTVTAVGPGVTIISASCQEQTVECRITVNENIQHIKILISSLTGPTSAAQKALSEKGFTAEMIEEYSDSTPSGHIIKISYDGYIDSDNYYIVEDSKVTLYSSLGENAVQSLVVETLPIKTVYSLGDVPSYDGLVLTALYADGSAKNISSGYTAPTTPLTTLGRQQVQISYGGLTTVLDLTVSPVPASSVTVSPASLTCKVGETKTLSAVISPANTTDESLTVSSSAPSIIKADGLRLTALKAGKATVTVRTASGKTAACEVTVEQEPSLEVKTKPMVTQYYVGDDFKQAGLTLTYTDAQGNVSTVATGYEVDCSTAEAGGQQVAVSYKGLTATFPITVRTPNVRLTKQTLQDRMVLIVETDPENISVNMTSSDDRIFYFEGNSIVAVSEGTAYAIATATYNGVEYTDSCPLTIQIQKQYNFSIVEEEQYEDEAILMIQTTIPEIDLSAIQWSVNRTDAILEVYPQEGRASVLHGGVAGPATITVTAVYSHAGMQYTDSYTILVAEDTYFFDIVQLEYENGYSSYGVKTDIPDFDPEGVTWTSNSNNYVNIEVDGEVAFLWCNPASQSYTVTVNATYIDGGKNYSDSYSFTVEAA